MNEESHPKDPATGGAEVHGLGANSPEAKAEADWQMPAPVFRVSEGKPVKKLVIDADETFPPDSEADTPTHLDAIPAQEPLPAGAGVGPHPQIKEEILEKAGPSEEKAPVKATKRSRVWGILFTLLIIFGIALALLTGLGLVYYYFFYNAGAGPFD